MNPRLLSRVFLAALFATAISLGTPYAFAGKEEDDASSEAADKADEAAGAADSAWDEYEKQKADAKDKGMTDKEAEKAAEEAKKAAQKAEADAKKAEDASKAADEKAKKADDKEIENRADKKEKADARKKRHDGRAARRKARAHLRELKAELAKRKRIGGKADSSKTKELEKEIEELEKSPDAQPAQPPPKQPVLLPGAERSPLGRGESLGSLTASGKVRVETSGTGETIGHVVDLKIENLTDQPINCVVGPMVLESKSRKNQDYVCPKPQTAKIEPRGTARVPINGVCVNRIKPPVGKGAPGDLIVNTGDPTIPQNPDSHIPARQARDLLRICTSKYDAADRLQKDGALKDLPYKEKQKQKDIVVQWSTWCDPRISEITGAPPATKEDLKKVVYKQVEEKGPMSPETKKKVDDGIDTIFAKVELTTAKAKDLEKPEEEIPSVLGTTGAGTPTATPTATPTGTGGPGTTVAATPTATPTATGSPGTTVAATPTATPTPPPKEEKQCTHDGKVAVGGKPGNKKDAPPPVEGDPEYDPKDQPEKGGSLKARVVAYAKTEGCCCLDEVTLTLEIKVKYKQVSWHRVGTVPGGAAGKPPPKAGVKGDWEWKADEQQYVRTVEMPIKVDPPECHLWKYDDDVKFTWDDIKTAFQTAKDKEKNWPPKGVSFEIVELSAQGVLRYKLKSDDPECPVPKGEQVRRSGFKDVKLIGGAEPPTFGQKPPKPTPKPQ